MVQLAQAVQAVEQEVRTGGDPLPVGYYKAVATSEEIKNTKEGDGKYISTEFQILAPQQYDKRKVWNMYNIVNKNNTTVEIALEQLGNFAWAAGITSLSDTKDLLFKEVTLELGIDPASTGSNGQTYPAKNKIKAYWPASWSDNQIEAHKKAKKAGSVTAAPAPAPTTHAPSIGAALWKKK